MKVQRIPKVTAHLSGVVDINILFQVVDMRWGVQDQASDDHSTSELCMNEIKNCQKESAGPTFVVSIFTENFTF